MPFWDQVMLRVVEVSPRNEGVPGVARRVVVVKSVEIGPYKYPPVFF